ncbi:MAG: hypothetical protein HY675_18965 [Chloroflexi bacterium]|nr:hypothetical protein [Chloroflexota bacterium]
MVRYLARTWWARLPGDVTGMALLALLLAGCVSQGSSHQLKLTLGDFYFKPDTLQVKVGQRVQIEIINEGKVEHEIMIGHAVELKNGRPEHFEHDFFERVVVELGGEKARLEREEGHGTMIVVAPGGRAIVTFTVPASRLGEWEIGCFRSAHYESGMKGKLVVRL